MKRSKAIKHSLAGAAMAAAMACAMAGTPEASRPLPELAGRTAGAPQRCVSIQPSQSLRIAGPQTVLYGTGRTIWVNQLASNCPGMDPMDILIVEPIGSQYCRGDRVRTADPVSRLPGPACILGDFVPYTR